MDDLDDATKAPSPLGGWSGRVTTLTNALIVATEQNDMIQPSGIFDAAGTYIHEGVLWRGRALMVPPPLPDVQDHLPGRWIWGGVLLNHFGHFLTESTGRLWALDAVKGHVDGIVFISKREVGDDNLGPKDYHKIFFDLMGVTVPIKVIAKPTRVDVLEVPGQGFGIGPLASGTDQFRRFVQTRFAKSIAPVGSERLYISRSELGAVRGGILEETRLERYLSDHGYEIFHPQKHSMQEQVARYKAARQIVALDGSALHLLGMVGTSDQRVAIIKRRDSGATDNIVRHIATFSQSEPLVIDAVRQDWIRSDRKKADRFSFGELDFAALGDALGKAGFVSPDVAWTTLTDADLAKAIGEIEDKLKRKKLTFTAILRGQRSAAPVVPEKRRNRHEERIAGRLARKAAAKD